MRILLIQRFDLSSVSCARRVLCQAEELLRRGHEVILTDFPHLERRQEVPSVVNLSNLGAQIIPLNRRIPSFLSNLQVLKKISPRPDLIHLWKSYPDASLPAIHLSHHWNIPLHYDWDDWEPGIAQELTGSRLAGWIASRWDRLLPTFSPTVSVASAFLRNKAVEYGVHPTRLWDAPVGADLERFYPRTRDHNLYEKLGLRNPVLVYSGQLEVATYVEQAIAVLALVRKEIQTAQLLVLGGGRKLEQFRHVAENFKVSKHVIFTDYVPADEVPNYLALADAALAPFQENDVTRAKSPLKIAEYLAMGLPIVASKVGEVPAMTIGSGVTAACGDVEDMSRQTLWVLRNPGVRTSMSAAGRKLAQRQYNWKTHVDTLLNAYQSALEP